jgi:hypothetical protein
VWYIVIGNCDNIQESNEWYDLYWMMCCVWTYDLRITLSYLACMYVCVHCSLSESYTIEASVLLIEVVNSHFQLYGCGYHHNHIDGASLDAGISDAEDDSIANYLEYYD